MRKPLLERFDNWLDGLSDFTHKHPTIFTIVVVIFTGTLVLLFFYAISAISDSGESDAPEPVWEGVVTLSDTRQVTCVRFDNGGVSCDWTHASGADQWFGGQKAE